MDAALDAVLGNDGSGWAGWIQANTSKVVDSYLPRSTLPATNGVNGTNAGVLAPPVSGLPATIGGMKFTTVVLIGGAVVVAAVILLRK